MLGTNLFISFSATDKFPECDYSLKYAVRRAIEATLEYEDFPYGAEISVTFCDNEYIKKLNSKFRDKDSATDVLSFPMVDFDDEEFLPLNPDRSLTLGVHSTEELCRDEEMLAAYATMATFSSFDEKGNPVKVYTADDIRTALQAMSCEYIMVFYAYPGNHSMDVGYEFKIVQAYWNDGLCSNSVKQMEIGSESGSYVYLALGAPDENGLFGTVYADERCEEAVGEFELYRTSLDTEEVPEE